MFLKDNPALMAEVEEKVKAVLGIDAKVDVPVDAGESTSRRLERSGDSLR